MSWAIAAQAGLTGASILAQSLTSGSGPKLDSKAMRKALSDGMKQLNAAVDAGRAQVAGAVRGMDRKIERAVGELRDSSDAETREFWNSLGLFNEGLIDSASALVESYDGDVMAALESLQETTNQLNESYAEDMGEEITRFSSINEAINERLAERSDVATDQFLGRIQEAEAKYEDRTLSEIDQVEEKSLSLGDEFLRKAEGSLGRFDSFVSSAPGTLDALSKSVFDTRQQLLAEADPRALELSQIADNNAAAMMSGQVSADMQANLARSSAMQALQGGFGAGSEMGRGLTARDLGLTSLDLQQRGFDDFQRQRALNYETRVAGTQETARGLFNSMLAGEQSLMGSSIGVAESDRNQRLGTVQEAGGQRIQTFDRLFGSALGTADTLRGQDMTLAAQRADMERDDNIRSSGMRVATTQDIYNNLLGLSDTVFNTRLGTAGQAFQTGLSVTGDIYRTNTGAAGQVYNTRTGIEGNIFGGRTQSAIAGMQAQAAYEQAALQAQAGMIQGNTATAANIPMQQMMNRQTSAQQSGNTWGSAFQGASSLAGSYFGNQGFSSMGGRSFGGGFSSPGGGRYEQLYGPATGGNTGLPTPAGFSNF